jgi:hypothetical protein
MIYQNPNPPESGHIAFVGNSNLTLFSDPPIERYQNRKGTSLGSDFLPVLVQAGTYTGVTSIVYGTSNWLLEGRHGDYASTRDYLLAEKLYFYRIKGGR